MNLLCEIARDRGLVSTVDPECQCSAVRRCSAEGHALPRHEIDGCQVAQQILLQIGHAQYARLFAGLKIGQGTRLPCFDFEPFVGDRVAVWVVCRLSKRIVDAPLEILGDRVLEAVCFGVNSVERDLERRTR